MIEKLYFSHKLLTSHDVTHCRQLQLGCALPLNAAACVCRDSEDAWTRQSKLHTLSGLSVFFFSISHSVTLLLVTLQPHVHTTAKQEQIPCLADTDSPLPGPAECERFHRMRCLKFLGPFSVGFYIWTAILFKGMFWTKSLPRSPSTYDMISVVGWLFPKCLKQSKATNPDECSSDLHIDTLLLPNNCVA